MVESESVIPGEKEIHDTEKMLAWVLWALMAYADKIGLSERGYR